MLARRDFLKLALCAPLLGAAKRTKIEEAFLDDLSHRAFLFFWEQADPDTGLVHDRAKATGGYEGNGIRNVASSAATGFGLTALCIGVERGWITRKQARERAFAALTFLAEHAGQEHGWFYHFVDASTGERQWKSEISSIDTALLLGGILTVRRYFQDEPAIARLAQRIYERVDFAWMLNGDPLLLSQGWKPESGFLHSRWDSYCEHSILYLLAIGSPTHPIPAKSWYAWRRPRIEYAGYRYITGGPLFVHQYSHAWIDLFGRRENQPPYIDYFENSVNATRAHRQFCIDLHAKFSGYSENVWGITASDSAKGYVAWGGPPLDPAIDGTVVPCAAGGSLMFTPEISIPALLEMRNRFGERVWKRYGFVDAFNPLTGWTDPDVIGIDLGITLLSAENLRSGNVWRWYMGNTEVARALDAVGLTKEGTRRPLAVLRFQTDEELQRAI